MTEPTYIEVTLGFSTADGEQVHLQFDGEDLVLSFIDWTETQQETRFKEVLGFRWDDEQDGGVRRGDVVYEVQASPWLARRVATGGYALDQFVHLKLCFNACGVLDVLCRRPTQLQPVLRGPAGDAGLEAVVQRGTWLYGGTVPAEVEIRRSWVAWGTGDHEDEPEVREARDTPCFYVGWGSPGEKGVLLSRGGPFASVLEARGYAERLANGRLRWSDRVPFFCPRCGQMLVQRGAAWICEMGAMELSRQLALDLRACFIEHTRMPSEHRLAMGIGGQWFCPGCGKVAIEADSKIECPSCHRALTEFVQALVELHPHAPRRIRCQ